MSDHERDAAMARLHGAGYRLQINPHTHEVRIYHRVTKAETGPEVYDVISNYPYKVSATVINHLLNMAGVP